MIALTTKLRVEGLTGREITDFLINAGDEEFRRWWPGTHLEYHTVRRRAGGLGNLLHYEELVGGHRERIDAVVVDLIPGRRLVWQIKRGIRLPIRVLLEFEDDAGGVTITQTTRAGFEGAGRILDPVFRLYFSREYEQALEAHARTEFPMLRDLLHAHA